MRSRTQCVSMKVWIDASQITPQCAPPSPSPSDARGWYIISRIGSAVSSE